METRIFQTINTMNNALMICGYRRHGKDHLLKVLNGEEENNVLFLYKDLNVKRRFLSMSGQWNRRAFADRLKEMSIEYLVDKGICRTLEDLESHKDDKDIKIGGNLYSFRDILLDQGMKVRKEDPDYFTNHVVHSSISQDKIALTDWRFPREYELLSQKYDTITIRVFRSSCPIPKDEETEISLNQFVTDILCLSCLDDLELACTLFSREYNSYIA